MEGKLTFEVATPDRLVVSETVDEVVLPSVNGYMGVLPGHAPLLALLDVGELSFRVGNERRYFCVAGGFAEVLRESVQILADTCEEAEAIDVERARRSQQRAEAELGKDLSESDLERAEVRLKKAMSRIRVYETHRR